MPFNDDVSRLLVRELEGFQRELALFPDDETVWRTVPGVTNSAGNLALHVSGNLQHFVGRLLGGTPYVRDRDAEFATRAGTRASLVAALSQTADTVRTTLTRLEPEALQRPMPGAPNGMRTPTSLFLLHLVAHTAFHLGQAGYLRRTLTGDVTSTHPVPVDALAERAPGSTPG